MESIALLKVKMDSAARQRGVSLIELMVGVVLGMLVVLAITSNYISQRQTMRATAALGARSDNLRAATELLARALREHGFDGCFTGNADGGSATSALYSYSNEKLSVSLPSTAPTASSSSETPISRLITVRYIPVAYQENTASSAVTQTAANVLAITGSHDIKGGHILNACPTAGNETVTVGALGPLTVVSVSGGNITIDRPITLTSGTWLLTQRREEHWIIKPNGRADCGKPVCNSLFYNPNGGVGADVELVPDIDQIMVRYPSASDNTIKITLTTAAISSQQAARSTTFTVQLRHL
ncbi:MAG: prepilin-type N-terminal cleavage/methylation domain-containing protein [Tepidimonas sp.]|uniref:PilW family protein n=1 Tax=Tepidimonas sp. TaxID=2002775 RepID=UPI00298F1E79|nr:prepilin-type N-terminal cleavage/methylation domain-containing protein [Tepidimonas sp.]MDW8336143.1 prepilin-type N-terminal cleavage/methylation domain-containing protein [Tepidimonas sp.]